MSDDIEPTSLKDIVEENDFDTYESELRTIFSIEDTKIQSLIEALNNHGANLGIFQFAKLTGLAETGKANRLRYVLGYFIHFYTHHREDFDKEFSESTTDKKVLESLLQFTKKLDKKGTEGLDIVYLSRQAMDGWPSVGALASAGVQVKYVTDDDDNIIALVPFIRTKMTTRDEHEKVHEHIVYLTLDEITTLIQGFQGLYARAKEESLKYKKTLGNLVIIPEGDAY